MGARHADLSAPIRTGTSLLIGVLLLVGSLRAGRRRSPLPVEEPADVPVEPYHPTGLYGMEQQPPHPYTERQPSARYTNDARYYPAEPEPGDAMSMSWITRTSRSAEHRW